MCKSIVVYTLLFVFLVSSVAAAATPAELTIMDKTAIVEKVLYGSEQTGSVMDRTAKLEHDLYGRESNVSLPERLDKLYTYMKVVSVTAPSFLMKLNAVEWKLTHTISNEQSVKSRVENVERVMTGNTTTGPLDDRLTKLMKLTFPGGQAEVVGTTLNKDTLVKIKILTPLHTRTSRVDEAVSFQAVEDVYAGGVLVVAKGAWGSGKVSKVSPAKNFGRDAELLVSFDTVDAFDGTPLHVFLGEKAKEETKSVALAAGASAAGMLLLGPIGIVGAAFVNGKEIDIPAGTEMYVQIKNDAEVFGIQVQ